MLPWFVASTLLLTGGTFLALRHLVLAPVEQLAEGARRLRSGDFSVRLEAPPRTDELAELVRSFNAMASQVQGFNARLEEEVRVATEKARMAEAAAMTQRRLAAMGELAAGIAHEINNPLGGQQNAVDVLQRDDLPAAKRLQYLELLSRGLGRIGETVARLRRFTPREAPRGPVDLGVVVQDALDLVRHRAQRLGVQLQWSPPRGPEAVVPGVRNEIGQALLNLLANALDSLEEAGTRDERGARIDVTLRSHPDEISIEVRDNGLGVEPAELSKVADLFYTTKEIGKGTGLGLALVHGAARAHGGRVSLESVPGQSFTATIWFPRVSGPEAGA
jgi:signal transduction histidine kinase